MISKSFIQSSLIYSIFGALPLASSIILLPFYTNLLSSNDFGLLAIYISLTLLIQILVNFSFDNMAGVHYYDYKDNPEKLKEFISTVSNSLILIGIGSTLVSLLTGPLIFKLIFKGEIDFSPYGFMSVITAVFNGFFRTYTVLLTYQQRAVRFLWMNLFNFILTIIISVVGLYLYPHTLVGPMYGRFLSGLGIFLLALFYFNRENGFHFKVERLKGVLAYCAPLVAYNLLSWVVSYIDRFIINDYMNPSAVGVYDFGVKCTLLMDFVLVGLTNAIMPKIYSIWKRDKINFSTPEVNKYYHSYSAINMFLIAATILFIPLIVPLVVSNQNYYAAFTFLPILAISFITRGLFNMYSIPVYFFKKVSVFTRVFFITALLQVPLSIVMVKYFGVWGAAWSLLLIKPIQLVLMAWQTGKFFKFSFNHYKMIYLPLAYAILVIGLTFAAKSYNYYLVNSISLVIVCVLIYLTYRNEIMQLFKFIKAKYV